MRFRSKVVEIDAWQWNNSPKQEATPPWVNDALFKWPEVGGIAFLHDHADGPRLCVASLEGVEVATPGYWIIRGLEGELYPCKPSVFAAKYEAVTA